MVNDRRAGSYRPSELTHLMILSNQNHKKALERSLDSFGLHRAQHRLLMTLACDRCLSQVELAKNLEVSPATIAVTLKSLEKAGLISRRAHQEDNRVNSVELTDAGRKIVEESREVFQALDERMYRGFSEEEKEQLCDFLGRIYENMQSDTATMM